MNDTDAILERADAMGKAWAASRNRIGLAGVMGEQYDWKPKILGDGMMLDELGATNVCLRRLADSCEKAKRSIDRVCTVVSVLLIVMSCGLILASALVLWR